MPTLPPLSTTTTTTSTTTSTTTTSTSVPGVTLWRSGMEGGALGDWSADDGGAMEDSGTNWAGASQDVAHSGSWSLKAIIDTSRGTSGVRAFRWKEPRANRQLFYSAWLYVPSNVRLTHDPSNGQYWNVLQFKSRTRDGSRVDPVWAIYAANDGQGGVYLRAGWGWGDTRLAGPYRNDGVGGKWFEPSSRPSLPVGRWVHLEAMLKQSRDFDGELAFWQDGVKTIDLTGIRTSYDNCNYNSWCADAEWSVNLYSDGTDPNPMTVYFDDAVIDTGYVD